MLRAGEAQLTISAELGHARGQMTAVYFGHAVTRFGDYSWMFIADAVLALLAAYGQPARARSAPGGRRHGLNNCRYARGAR